MARVLQWRLFQDGVRFVIWSGLSGDARIGLSKSVPQVRSALLLRWACFTLGALCSSPNVARETGSFNSERGCQCPTGAAAL